MVDATGASVPPRSARIRFMAPVNGATTSALLQCVDRAVAGGVQELHLMLSTPGGSVFHGLSIHNCLRGLAIPVHTYNFGSVDSIGIVIFCAGSQRISVPHARFLIHSVSLVVNGQLTLDLAGIKEHLNGLKMDAQNVARVIADTVGCAPEVVTGDMARRTTLGAEEAQHYGLVTRVAPGLPSSGSLYAICEDARVFEFIEA